MVNGLSTAGVHRAARYRVGVRGVVRRSSRAYLPFRDNRATEARIFFWF